MGPRTAYLRRSTTTLGVEGMDGERAATQRGGSDAPIEPFAAARDAEEAPMDRGEVPSNQQLNVFLGTTSVPVESIQTCTTPIHSDVGRDWPAVPSYGPAMLR